MTSTYVPPAKRDFGDEKYGPYGFGYCNPAYTNQNPVTNEQYLSTIPEDDVWYEPIMAGVALLNEQHPGWVVVQIKEKFAECRFYATPASFVDAEKTKEFHDLCRQIEVNCDAV